MLRGPVLRLVRFPGLLLSVVAGALMLGTVSAGAPIFLGAVGSLTLHRFVSEAATDEIPALVVTADSAPSLDVIEYRTRVLEREIGHALADPIVTVRGDQVTASGPDGSTHVRIVSRTGALEHVERLAGGDGDGVWLADTAAELLGVDPGDVVEMSVADGTASVVVAGVYRDLFTRPRTAYWATLDGFIYPSATDNTRPPTFVLMDLPTYAEIEAALLDDQDVVSWEFPFPTATRSLEDAAGLVAVVDRFRARLANATLDIGSAFPRVNVFEAYEGFVGQTRQVVAAIEGPVQTISLAGRAVGLALIGGAGVFMIRRRRTELALLHARGVGPGRTGARTAAESVAWIAAGAAAGWALALGLVRAAEPASVVAPSALRSATTTTAVSAASALAILAVVVGRSTAEASERGSDRARRAATRVPWDALLLAAAALALLALRTERPADPAATMELDRLLLVFPLLFIAGAAGLAARLLRWAVPWLRSRGSGLSTPAYLASRRLAAAPTQAAALLVAGAVAVGILVYAGAVSASVEATALQDASLRVGSRSSVAHTGSSPPLEAAPFAATSVVRFERGSFAGLSGSAQLDVLAVDPSTFADVAYWQGSFADQPLDRLVDRLSSSPSDGLLPVVVAGRARVPPDPVLELSGYDLPMSVIGRARAFPGAVGGRPLVVVDRAVLDDQLAERGATIARMAHRAEIWAGVAEEELRAFAQDRGVTVIGSTSADDLLTTPAYLALTSMLRFLAVTGTLAGLVVLLGTHLYLQARQRQAEAAYSLLRRMGLSRAAHRRSIGIELAGLLLAAFGIGAALALLSSWIVNDRIQAGPLDAQIALYRAPVPVLAATAAVLLVAAAIGAALVQRRADRTNVAEVMRVAG